jgi:hypothetical protein
MSVRETAFGALLCSLLLALGASRASAGEPPPWLPRYDLAIRLDTDRGLVSAAQRVTWTNSQPRPARQLVFNAHARYTIPDEDTALLAKTVEILRMAPREALSFDGPALEVQKASVVRSPLSVASHKSATDYGLRTTDLTFHYQDDNPTALVVPLPFAVMPGESVTVDLNFTLRLPRKKGRWGQWNGITMLAQWLPVVAYYGQEGWESPPFIPWHQPFFNEAGLYSARITLPADQKLASTGVVAEERDLGNGWREVAIEPTCARDFSLVCSSRFVEFTGKAGPVNVRVLALPEHEFYGREIVQMACEALPVYGRWFGPYPNKQLTVVEACFGWNGNECGGMVMIDERIFNFPHLARGYVDYLVSHEICHQWWYNAVGTNGYAETWMDEGLATYFSHRLIDRKLGKNNPLLDFPRGLRWLPNIHREDFRNYGMLGVMARGEGKAAVQEMKEFGHLINLSGMTYDRGSRIVGMIEERLGEEAFFDFMRRVYDRYCFRILRVKDFQRELEEYTGRSWDEFFRNWLYRCAMCDWAVERVEIEGDCPRAALARCRKRRPEHPVRVIVHLKQKRECNEPVVLGICLDGGDSYQIRLPIHPDIPVAELAEFPARIESITDGFADERGFSSRTATVRVEILLPSRPTQISADPDRVLLDANPTNNHWKPKIRWRMTPLYFQLDEADVTNAHDTWNVIAGPWLFDATYADPWYTRSPMLGLRVGAFRTQSFSGGGYLAYRTDDRNFVAGLDAHLAHFPGAQTEVGINVERSLATVGPDDMQASRGVLFGRYILTYGSSLYLPPFEYVELFASAQNRWLPGPVHTFPGADLFDDQVALGIHYHKNYLTPYWDPEAGVALDVTYQAGLPIFGSDDFQQVFGQISTVKTMPDPYGWLSDSGYLGWLAQTRWAFRLMGAAGLPDRGQFFSLGGGEHFRGFDLRERQGNITWTASVEWRLPIFKDVCWDVCDHMAGVRNVYLAAFYDVGDAYLLGRSFGPVAHAVGAGLRVDVAWLGLIERTVFRFDIAQTVNADSPLQLWFGIQHPF